MFPVPSRARLAFALVPALAVATIAPASAATIAGARVDATSNGGAAVTVQFTSGNAPSSRVLGQNTTEVSVNFDNTTLGAQAPPTIAGAGPVGSVSLVQNGNGSSVALHLTAATTVTVRTSGPAVVITVAPTAASAPPNPFGAQAPVAAGPTVGSAPAPGTQNVMVMLKYADVSEIAGVLVANSTVVSNDNFAPQQSSVGASSVGNSFGGGGGFTAPQQQTFAGGGLGQAAGGLAQRLNDNVAIDRRLNAIVLTGTPDVIAPLKEMIDKLDVPLPSVVLETEVVELNDTASKDLGLELAPAGGGLIVNGNGGTTGNSYTIKSLQTGMGQITLGFGANLYGEITAGNGRVLAKPRILAQSGQQASIITGDAIPILTTVAAQTVTSQQVNYVNVGVNLQIQPRVSSDGYVTSHIYCDVSSVTGFTSGAPQISQRTASTLATVKDGESFVIGGLLQDNETRSLSKLPLIGDIPILGAFFRHLSTSKTQTNLYIVVTPHIVGVGESTAPPPVGFPLSLPKPLPQSSAPPAPIIKP